MTGEELRTWAQLHLAATQQARKLMADYQPMAAFRLPDGSEFIAVLSLPKEQVAGALSRIAREAGAVAIALCTDCYVGPSMTPAEYEAWQRHPGQRVRDKPGAMDAIVVQARRADGLTGMWISRYLGAAPDLCYEPAEWYGEGVQSSLLPAPWEPR